MYGGYYVGLPPTGHNGTVLLPQRRALQRPADLRRTSAWACTRCRATCGGAPGASCRRRTVRGLPSTDPDFSWQGQWPMARLLADLHRPAVRPGSSASGKGHYTYPGTSPDLHPDLRRRHVRGADGRTRSSRRPRWGTAQLRPGRRAHRCRCRSSTPRSSWATRSGACRRRARRTTPAATAASASRGWRSRTTGRARPRATRTWALPVPRLRHRERRHPARVVPRAGRRAAAGLRQHPGAAHRCTRTCTRARRLLRRGEPDHRRGRPPATWCSTSR